MNNMMSNDGFNENGFISNKLTIINNLNKVHKLWKLIFQFVRAEFVSAKILVSSSKKGLLNAITVKYDKMITK